MNNARNTLKSAMQWIAVLVTVIGLLAPGAFASNSASKSLAKKGCCQRCACCIGSNPDQPQVPLAFPTSSRSTVDQPAALPLALIAGIFAQPESLSHTANEGLVGSPLSSAPIFLRDCAILI